MLNPEWLRYFVCVAETRNFHQAAEQLHVTPQALSHAIAGLETYFKSRLIDRDKRVKGLTPAGEALLLGDHVPGSSHRIHHGIIA